MKAAGYTLTKIDATRYRASRGPRHAYLTKVDRRWRQTTKDGGPTGKSIPPRDFERIVAVIEGEV